jgi:ParB/RepB/Spo0J family partition protein
MQIETIEIECFVPDPNNPRQKPTQEELAELVASIKAHEIKVPLIAYRVPAGIMIWDGHLRWEAGKLAGKKTLPAIVFAKRPEEADALLSQIVINGQRTDFNPVDRYEAYSKLAALKGWSAAELAAAICVAPAKVSSIMALGKLTAEERELVRQRKIPESSAYTLARIPPEKRTPLMAQAASGQLTRDQLNSCARQKKESTGRAQRISCVLPGGSVVVQAAEALNFTSLIELLEELLRNCRKARSEGIDISTAVRVWRDRFQTAAKSA